MWKTKEVFKKLLRSWKGGDEGIVIGVARLAAQIESVPTNSIVGTVSTVQPSAFVGTVSTVQLSFNCYIGGERFWI